MLIFLSRVLFYLGLLYIGFSLFVYPEKTMGCKPFFFKKYTYEIKYNRKTNPYYHKQLRLVGFSIIIGAIIGAIINIFI